MRVVPIERDRVLDFARHGPDMHLDAETMQPPHEFCVEVGDRHWFERKAFNATIAGFYDEAMVGKVKGDIERATSMGHCRRDKSACGHKECSVPPMID